MRDKSDPMLPYHCYGLDQFRHEYEALARVDNDGVWYKREEVDAELADLRAENARLNAMRQHCERCGGDYLATGVETGCPCALRAENIALHERVAALESPEVCTVAHDDVATCGYCQRDAYKEDAANYYRLATEADAQQAALRARDAELSALLEACAPYLKDGETPAERIERERRDVSTAVKALAHERVRNAELRVRVADCFMIIRRLAHNGSAPNRAMAIDFLKRHGETGDILRDDPSAEASHTHVPDQFLPFRVEEQTGSYPHQNEWEVWTAGDDDTSFQVAVCNSKLMAEAIAHYGRELMQRAHPRQESVR